MTWQIDTFLSHLQRLAPRAVVETSGWRTRNNRTSWAAGSPIGIMAHHSASDPREAPGPAVNRIINGWSGLPGPVYGVFVVPTGDIHLIAAGPANHAGQGISAVRDRTRNGLAPLGNAAAADNMNGNAWFFSVGGQHRGTYPEWPAVQVTGIVAVCAAFCLARGFTAARAIHHREWTRRRIDMSYRGDLRGRTAATMAGTPIPPAPPTDWLDMDASTLRTIVRTEVHQEVLAILRADEFRLDRSRRLQDDFRGRTDWARSPEFDMGGVRADVARTLAIVSDPLAALDVLPATAEHDYTAGEDYGADVELTGNDA